MRDKVTIWAAALVGVLVSWVGTARADDGCLGGGSASTVITFIPPNGVGVCPVVETALRAAVFARQTFRPVIKNCHDEDLLGDIRGNNPATVAKLVESGVVLVVAVAPGSATVEHFVMPFRQAKVEVVPLTTTLCTMPEDGSPSADPLRQRQYRKQLSALLDAAVGLYQARAFFGKRSEPICGRSPSAEEIYRLLKGPTEGLDGSAAADPVERLRQHLQDIESKLERDTGEQGCGPSARNQRVRALKG